MVSYNETGSLLSTLAWDFSAFTRTVTGVQASNGVVGGNSDTFQAWQTAVLTGTGGTGTLTTTGHGTYSWNTREYWYDLPGTGVTTTLTGISLGTVGKLGEGTLPPDLRTAVTLVTTKAPAFGAGVLQQAVAGQQQAVLGVAAGLQGVGGLVAAPPQVLGLMPLAGQALPPSWSGVGVLGPNGGSWVGLQGPAAQAGAWGWLSTQATNLWALVGGAYQEASQRAQNAQPLSDPLTLQGQGLWNRQLGQLPAGTVRGRNWQAAIGDGWDALVGTIDGLTSGLRQGLNALGLGGVATLLGGPLAWLGAGINAFVGGVNESSAAYQQGRMVGQVAALAISFLPVGLPLKLALGVAQGLGGGLEALARGDWWGVAAGFTGAVLSGLGLAGVNSACGLLQSTNAGLRLLGRAMQGLQVVSAAAGVVQGARALAEGDILGGLLQIGMSARSLTGLMRACFPAGTPVLSAEDEGFNELLLLALAAAAFLIGVLGDRMMNDRRKREQEEAEEDLAPDYFLTIDYLGENP